MTASGGLRSAARATLERTRSYVRAYQRLDARTHRGRQRDQEETAIGVRVMVIKDRGHTPRTSGECLTREPDDIADEEASLARGLQDAKPVSPPEGEPVPRHNEAMLQPVIARAIRAHQVRIPHAGTKG